MKKIRMKLIDLFFGNYSKYYDSKWWPVFNMRKYIRNKRLCKKYYFLKPRNVFSGNTTNNFHYQWTELDTIPKGWRKALGMELVKDLDKQLKKDKDERFMFMEIKEKFGALRMYCNGASREVLDLLDDYECVTENICIQCGKLNVPMLNIGGWYTPLCDKCYKHVNYKKAYNELTSSYEKQDFALPTTRTIRTWNKEEDSEQTIIRDLTYITRMLR